MRLVPRLLVLLAATTAVGCAYVVQDVMHALVDEEAPPETWGPTGGVPPEAIRRPLFDDDRPAATASGLQYAPTLDWRMGLAPLPHAPGRSLFEGMAARRMPCQSVPVGLAQAFSGPTGPAASPITRSGILEVGVAGPDGSIDAATAWNRNALATRALSSGARMASAGPTCAMRVYLYLRIGRTDEAVSVLR